ncbi:hypothetical protein K474DRAFT_1662655 [Panus rudis PR-1116 ss-1]|nr:hypothetical protein K474DRAFT_1662655 [Panus rudis PR-1116 ss-1]
MLAKFEFLADSDNGFRFGRGPGQQYSSKLRSEFSEAGKANIHALFLDRRRANADSLWTLHSLGMVSLDPTKGFDRVRWPSCVAHLRVCLHGPAKVVET